MTAPLTDRDHALVEAVAVRVVELLAAEQPPAPRLVDAFPPRPFTSSPAGSVAPAGEDTPQRRGGRPVRDSLGRAANPFQTNHTRRCSHHGC